jgi:2-haloalkanoic acid dehalogenase type II
MTWHGVGALTFDVYGTLIDWRTGVAEVLVPWAADNGLGAGRTDLLDVFLACEGARQQAEPELRYPQILELAFVDLAARFGVRPDPDTAEAFGDSVGTWPTFADVPGALARLAQHCRLAAIANVDRASLNASARRLGAAFDVAVTAEDAGAYKPDPAPFRQALTELSEIGVDFDRIVHVAQSGDRDLEPARSLGLATWHVAPSGDAGEARRPEPPADRCFAAMADLAAAVVRASDGG